MEINNLEPIHPLMAGAAVPVILVSLGIAAIGGVLPNSHAAAGASLLYGKLRLLPHRRSPARRRLPRSRPVAPQVQQLRQSQRRHEAQNRHCITISVQHAQVHAQPATVFPRPLRTSSQRPPTKKAAPVAQNSLLASASVQSLEDYWAIVGGGKGKRPWQPSPELWAAAMLAMKSPNEIHKLGTGGR
jgi:hypothetical protein